MKKILIKDKQNRILLERSELKHFILKQISNNDNFTKLTKWNALSKLSNLPKKGSKTYITNRCVKTVNKKSFTKFSNLSRMIFLKLVRNGFISGFRKSSW